MRRTAAAMGVIACLGVLALVLRGCGEAPIPSDGWVRDLKVMNRDYEPIDAEVSTRVGQAFDVVVSFEPGTPRPEAFPEHKLLEQNLWRVRAEILDEDGTRITDRAPGGIYDELLGFDSIGTESIEPRPPRPGDFGELLWISPEPPEAADPDTRSLWGRVLAPPEPGTYTLVVRLYPAAHPPNYRNINPEFGPPITLWETPLRVAPGEPRDRRIVTGSHPAGHVPRKMLLKMYKSDGTPAGE